MSLVAWIGIPLLHAVWMMIDLNLRDPARPMVGGIPASATSAFQLISLVALCVLMYFSTAGLRSKLARAAIAVAATAIAFVLMLVGWLHYVISNGIDTV